MPSSGRVTPLKARTSTCRAARLRSLDADAYHSKHAIKGPSYLEFGFNRSRGILIKASHGEITGNRLEGCWMSAILVAPECWWLEAGSSTDLTITGNSITNCGAVPICVEASGGNGGVAPAGAHRNIAVSGILATTLQNHGFNVDFAMPWAQGHGGDYDLDELSAWTDQVSRVMV